VQRAAIDQASTTVCLQSGSSNFQDLMIQGRTPDSAPAVVNQHLLWAVVQLAQGPLSWWSLSSSTFVPLLHRVITKYGCFSKEEVLTGWVVDQSGRHTRKRMDLRQQVSRACKLELWCSTQ
jgi:hypothetical protein